MKKKVIGMVLCTAMAVSLLAGCGGGTSSDAVNSVNETETNEAGTNETGTNEAETNEAEKNETQTSNGNTSSEAFDNFTRPVIKSDGKLTIACIHPKPEVESQKRSILQCQLESENRGWEFQDIVYQSDSEWADLFKNVVNQGVDAIILGSTESMEAKVDLIQDARNKGIGVYSNDNQVVDGVIMNSTMPNGSAAMNLIYKIGNDVGWKGKFGFATAASIQVHSERILPIQAICDIYSNLEVLDTVDSAAGGSDPATYCSDAAKAWFQKYGTEMTGVIASCDFLGMPIAEAAEQNKDLVNPAFFVAGIDGGSDAWSYIRNGSYFKYSYAQPFEMFTHKVFEAIDQIQVKGLNPGDENCILTKAGEVLYSEGLVISQDNVPEVGANINSIFDYYDDTADAWYNWEGTYTVSE